MSRPPLRPSPLSLHALAIGLVVAIGVGWSLVSYRAAREVERVQVETEFFRRADIQHSLTREILTNYEAGLLALRTLFMGDESPSMEEFQLAAREVMARYQGIVVLEWIPVVAAADRSRVEADMSRALGRPFEIVEPAGNLPNRRADARPEYYPILFIEPLARFEASLGYDLKKARPWRRSNGRAKPTAWWRPSRSGCGGEAGGSS